MSEEEEKFGCLYFLLPEEIQKLVYNFAESNIDKDTLTDDGIEKNPHVTLIYGLDSDVEFEEVQTIIKPFSSPSVLLGPITRFECDDFDVLKIDVISSSLELMNNHLRQVFEGRITNMYPEYQPHITLGYVKKGTNIEIDGQENFLGMEFLVSDCEYTIGDTKKGSFELKERTLEFDNLIQSILGV